MQNKAISGLIGCWLVSLAAWAAEPFSTATIPAGLSTGASAVVRVEEHTFRVKTPSDAVETVHYAVTILKQDGQSYASVEVPYGPGSKVANLEGTLYNAEGKVVRRLKRSDIRDLSAVSDGSLFEDSRMKEASFTYADYPYTVEFRYEINTTNTLFFPPWFPQRDNKLALETATFRVIMPAGQPLRYKTLNQLPAPESSEEPGGRSYTWQLKNRKAIENEPYAPYYTNLGPGILTASDEFVLDTRKGSMHTWQELGRFLYDLNANRDQLPESLRQQALGLVAGETDNRKKIQKLYNFVQQHTRYVSIQLGIGGWQTFPAAVVAEKGYGDCKALSNYTAALLKAVNIPSYLAAVKAGRNAPDIWTDFPSSQFNHMILCVPTPKDTVWLECTDQHDPAGYLGGFTSNRHVLLLTPEGGKLVRTPVYRPTDNRQDRRVTLRLTTAGPATATVRTIYTGMQAEPVESVMRTASPDDQRQWLYEQFHIPNFSITSFSFQAQKQNLPEVVERLTLQLPNGTTRSGNRLFVVPNQVSQNPALPLASEQRTAAFQLPSSYLDTDTVVCELPAGLSLEHAFEPVQLSSRFGKYQASVRAQGSTIQYVRRLEIYGGLYAADQFGEYVDFRKKIVRSDHLQIVLKNEN